MTNYEATSEQWGAVEATHTLNQQDFNHGSSNTAILIDCILELRSRIEKLEAERGAWKAVEKLYEENGEGLKQLAKIEAAERFSPLVERVARVICESCHEDPDHNGDARGNTYRWMDYADCADVAIREVAAWLRDTHGRTQIPNLLDKEVIR
jgi:hypothetical protein